MNNPLLEIERLVVQHGWADIAEKTISRECIEVETGGDVWHLPYSIYKNTTINFSKIENIGLRWCVKRYIQDRLQSTSAHAAYIAFTHLWSELFSHYQDIELNINVESIEESLIELLEKTLSKARANHRLWAMYRIIQWYIWSAENYPELGFSLVYANELDCMTIPGNPKGEAVRMEDTDKGPLHRSLELPLLIKAMREDKSIVFEHLQQKAALALSIDIIRINVETEFVDICLKSHHY